jgi:hypothetical protein
MITENAYCVLKQNKVNKTCKKMSGISESSEGCKYLNGKCYRSRKTETKSNKKKTKEQYDSHDKMVKEIKKSMINSKKPQKTEKAAKTAKVPKVPKTAKAAKSLRSADGRFEAVSSLVDSITHKMVISRNGGVALTWRETLRELTNSDFAVFFAATIAASPFEYFFFECPPITLNLLDTPFEYVTVQSHHFSPANSIAFADKLKCNSSTKKLKAGAAFRNIGGDATLVAPCQVSGVDAETYGHVAAFVRRAPKMQIAALLGLVSTTLQCMLDKSPRRIWLSTAGMGVPWLHFRLGSAPKYYRTANYKH